MWLIDVNLPVQFKDLLKDFGITAEHAIDRGWRNLSNGKLAEAAHAAGFKVILTVDNGLYGEVENFVRKTQSSFPQIAFVLIKLKQQKLLRMLDTFKEEYKSNPIKPEAGKLLVWPR